MPAFLFAWNPIKWPWDDIEDDINHLEETGVLREHWSCASHRKIKPGDRAFIVTVAMEPKGIVGSGYVASEPFLAEHWSGKEKKRALYYRVKLEIDILLNPKIDPILTLDILKLGALEHQQWAPQASGISIRPEAVYELEAVWFDFLATQPVRHAPFKSSPKHNIPRKTSRSRATNAIRLRGRNVLIFTGFRALFVVLILKKRMVKSVGIVFISTRLKAATR